MRGRGVRHAVLVGHEAFGNGGYEAYGNGGA